MTVADWADGARWALAGIFVVSAVAKAVRRQTATQRAEEMRVLGVPARVAPAVGIVLPIIECAIALLLILVPARWPVVVAIAFLAVVTLLVVRAVVRKVDAPCRCFGGLTARPLSWRTVARNGVLLGLAALAWATPNGVDRPTGTALACFLVAFAATLAS